MSVATSYAPTSAGVSRRPLNLSTSLLWLQGFYYLVTGIWPLVSIETFQMVTGPKTDHLQAPSPTETTGWS